jgi:4-hydroxybenzoate polyprenyltransferase
LIAAGCVLNDVMDRNIDKINKPKSHVIDNTISLIHSKLIFLAISILIVLLTAYISYYVFTE